MVAQEMYYTEINYLNALQTVIKFRDNVTNEKTSDGQPLCSAGDAVLIFGRLDSIIDCHRKISAKLEVLLDAWSDSNCDDIAKIWIECGSDLFKVYSQYLNNFEISTNVLQKACAAEQFNAFLRMNESGPDFKRSLLKDLLLRPVQRLPSVILLLREMQKRSEKSRQRCYEDAIGALGHVLTRANQMRATADEVIEVHRKYTEIEAVPAFLVKHSRKFLFEVYGSIIGYTDPTLPGQVEKKLIRLVVSHDCIIVCEIRDVHQSSNVTMNGTVLPSPSVGGTFRRIARQVSLSTRFGPPQKRYRYLFYIPLNLVRDVREVQHRMVDDQYNMQPVTNDGQAQLFVLNIRRYDRDDMLLFHPADVAMMGKIKDYLFSQILVDFNRSIGVDPISVVVVENLHPELKKVIREFIKRGNVHNATPMPVPSANYPAMPRAPGAFRKAVDSATHKARKRLGRSKSPAGVMASCSIKFVEHPGRHDA